ncbi:TIGR04222 domain-containing membrane protein [Streptomyces sp. 7N604]|uniref:TIGR04222 domain-containing membrane protein n=1 Tax=Streptomyces sp. 7N604 TaxID=3457415 RepID=UPI003FD6B114
MWVLFLLVAWVAAVASAARLCHAAATAGRTHGPASTAAGGDGDREGRRPAPPPRISIYEAAFLAGGPRRVADLTLLSMSRQRRLLLAHTGWATVVDPEGRDDLERSVITAIGPGGQSRIPAIRAALTAADAVRTLADRLVAAGLAVPPAAVTNIATAVRQAQYAGLLVLLTGAAALFVLPPEESSGPVAAWFALPLVLVTGCLAIAHVEIHPGSLWASPAGQRMLGRIAATPAARTGDGARDGAGDATAGLTAFAVRGPAALDDPALRAALSGDNSSGSGHPCQWE